MLHFHKTKVERYFLSLPPRGEGQFLPEAQLNLSSTYEHGLPSMPVISLTGCEEDVCKGLVFLLQKIVKLQATHHVKDKLGGFPESPGNTTDFMKIISKYFPIFMHVQCTVGWTRSQRGYNTPLLEEGRGCCIGSASSSLLELCFRKLAMFITSPVYFHFSHHYLCPRAAAVSLPPCLLPQNLHHFLLTHPTPTIVSLSSPRLN